MAKYSMVQYKNTVHFCLFIEYTNDPTVTEEFLVSCKLSHKTCLLCHRKAQ